MTTASENKSDPLLNGHLASLVASKAITQFQADWIKSVGRPLDENAFSHPHLHTVREHTRAFLESRAMR